MRDRNWDRWGAVAGLVMVAAYVVAILLTGSPPKPTEADQVFKQYIIDKSDQLVTQAWFLALASALFLWFGSAVRSVLRGAEGATGHLANVFFGTVVANVALIIVSCSPAATLAYGSAETATPSFARFVYDFGGFLTTLLALVMAFGALAFAIVVFSTDALPRWTGWLAVLLAVGSIVGSFVIFGSDGAFSIEGTGAFLPFVLFQVWAIGTAVAMLQRLGAPRVGAERGA